MRMVKNNKTLLDRGLQRNTNEYKKYAEWKKSQFHESIYHRIPFMWISRKTNIIYSDRKQQWLPLCGTEMGKLFGKASGNVIGVMEMSCVLIVVVVTKVCINLSKFTLKIDAFYCM